MRAAAKQRGIPKYYTMNKAQLMQATGMSDSKKSAPRGDKRAQATARKSGVAVSFGADKLAAKYGVKKEDLVKGARKALKQAEKAKGGALTPQEKRKAVAGSLSGATSVERMGVGMIKKSKRDGTYGDLSREMAGLPKRKSKSKGGLTSIDGGKKTKGDRSPFAKPVMDLMDVKAKTDRMGADAAKIQKKQATKVRKNLKKTKQMTESGETKSPKRLNARIKRTTETRLGDRLASSRQKEGNLTMTIKDARKWSRKSGLGDGQSIISKPKTDRAKKVRARKSSDPDAPKSGAGKRVERSARTKERGKTKSPRTKPSESPARFDLAADSAKIERSDALRGMEKRRHAGYLRELNPRKESDRAFRDAIVYNAGLKKDSAEDHAGAFAGMDRVEYLHRARGRSIRNDADVVDIADTLKQSLKGVPHNPTARAGVKFGEEIYDRLSSAQRDLFAQRFRSEQLAAFSKGHDSVGTSPMFTDIEKRLKSRV